MAKCSEPAVVQPALGSQSPGPCPAAAKKNDAIFFDGLEAELFAAVRIAGSAAHPLGERMALIMVRLDELVERLFDLLVSAISVA